MFIKLFLLFTIIPLIELALLIKIGAYIGVLMTISIVIITGILGAYLAKYEGLSILSQIKTSLNQGEIPTDEMIEGLLILVGGALLLTPGFLTDLLGFSLIIPFTRIIFRKFLKKKFKEKISGQDIYFDINI